MDRDERSLVEDTKHAAGSYGGFSFGGQEPEGVTVHNPLPEGMLFFPFCPPCPVKSMPYEMQSLFHWGESYLTGVNRKEKEK